MTAHGVHFWRTESRHATSEGVVTYQRCACGQRRITVTGSPSEVYAVREGSAA